MSAKSGDLLVTELVRRLTNLDRVTALAAINRAQKWCLRQGTYQFQMAAPTQLTVTLQATPQLAAKATLQQAMALPAMDAGKARMVLNDDGSPVQHVPWSEFWASLNFNLPTSAAYDTYTIQTATTTGQITHTFYFFPNQTGTVELYYHKSALDLADDAASFSTLPMDFDDLLVDLAESEERRIYDIGDSWQLLMQRSQEQIKALLDGYRSSTQQPTGLSDASVKLQETGSLGRA